MFFIIYLGYSTTFKSAESANLGVNSTKNINFQMDLSPVKEVALFIVFEKYENNLSISWYESKLFSEFAYYILKIYGKVMKLDNLQKPYAADLL